MSRPPKGILLDFHRVLVHLSADDDDSVGQQALESLRQDFEAFESHARAASPGDRADASRDRDVAITITLSSAAAPNERLPRGRPIFRNRLAAAYGWGRDRACDYGEGAWCLARNLGAGGRTFDIHAPVAARLHELGYVALLSSVGEELDRRGYHRVHALGVEAGSRAGFLLLPTGGGKSSFAALICEGWLDQTKDDPRGAVQLFSDESPLVRGDTIHPFPVRIALIPEVARLLSIPGPGRHFERKLFGTKQVHPIPHERIAAPARATFVLIGKISPQGQPRFRKATRAEVLTRLLKEMVVGIGLAQMAEQMIRVPGVLGLGRIAFSRLRTALRLTFASRSVRELWIFEVGPDPVANAEALARYLRSS
jgi:hypothetical protein